MLKGFDKLPSTQVGLIAERIVQEHLKRLGTHIHTHPDLEYRPSHDFTVSIEGKVSKVEVKGDNFPGKSRNIPIEARQANLNNILVDSGIRTTKSEYFMVYCFRYDTLYTFKVADFKRYLASGYISDKDLRLCNEKSETGKTECYFLDIVSLESDEFFYRVEEGVLSKLAPNIRNNILNILSSI